MTLAMTDTIQSIINNQVDLLSHNPLLEALSKTSLCCKKL
ncbi:MAG: hypothetical protein JETT_0381 [Candidatus Jettenia ecosi]|uniref:Uncharacterized protein n=1 Tax=Candidatus Jettenia ecosi TaxID=2494326 RepID=A0A533QF36_9BACT|nr:MAG: hypothetical protein JETT_0381 [Candidatus Jettenia ecosi]